MIRLFSALVFIFVSTGNAFSDDCADVSSWVSDMNRSLPVQADEITRITSARSDCGKKSVTIDKAISIGLADLESSNRLWKYAVEEAWNNEICSTPEAKALSGYGWKWSQRLLFNDGKTELITANCAGGNSVADGGASDYTPRISAKKAEMCLYFGSVLDSFSTWQTVRTKLDRDFGGYANDEECVKLVVSVAPSKILCNAIRQNDWSSEYTRYYHYHEVAKRGITCRSSGMNRNLIQNGLDMMQGKIPGITPSRPACFLNATTSDNLNTYCIYQCTDGSTYTKTEIKGTRCM